MNLLALNIALRAATAAWLLLTAALLMRDHGRLLAGRLAALFAFGVAAYALQGTAAPGAPVHGWQAPMVALSAGNGLVFWLFSRALFDDEFELRPRHLAGWVALVLAGLANCFVLTPLRSPLAWPVSRALELAPLVFALLAVRQTFATWRDDLVEKRRRLRAPLVAVVAGFSVLLAIVKLALPAGTAPEAGPVIEAVALALLVAVVMSRLLRLRGADLFGMAPDAALPKAEAAPAAPQALDPADQPLVAELQRRMADEGLYREENLTIGALADRLGLPEHRLRRLINQGLGHRNFSAFLNGYRLQEAKRALADPARAEVPVLTIALEAGFQSVGPFNRAFKADTGSTPSEYRRLHLGQRVPAEDTSLADSEIG